MEKPPIPPTAPRASLDPMVAGIRIPPTSVKFLWIAVLYLAQGFPYGLINNTMPVAFSKAGVDLKKIGLLALAGLPWTFKFLWAPLIDRLGGRRRWIVVSLFLMAGLTIVFGGTFDGTVTGAVWALIIGIAILSATQDIAIDAYSIELLNERELGNGNGIRVTAYRIALILTGGALVAAAGAFGWHQAWMIGGGALLVMGLVATMAPRVEQKIRENTKSVRIVLRDVSWAIGVPLAAAFALYQVGGWLAWSDNVRIPLAVVVGLVSSTVLAFRSGTAADGTGASSPSATGSDGLRRLLARPGAWGILLFILTFKMSDAAMAMMTTPFLDRGAHFSESEIGLLRGTVGLFAAIGGALLGGFLTSRWGIFRALWILGLFQAISNFGYTYAAYHPVGRVVWIAGLAEDFCGGLGTAPFLALLMSLCEKEHAATQYAFLSAVYSLCRSLAGAFSGYLAASLGFGPFFGLTFLLALPAFALLPRVKRWVPDTSFNNV